MLKYQRLTCFLGQSYMDTYTNPDYSFGMNGNIYIHQQRICQFLQGI